MEGQGMTEYSELVKALRFCARWHRADDALANAEQAAAGGRVMRQAPTSPSTATAKQAAATTRDRSFCRGAAFSAGAGACSRAPSSRTSSIRMAAPQRSQRIAVRLATTSMSAPQFGQINRIDSILPSLAADLCLLSRNGPQPVNPPWLKGGGVSGPKRGEWLIHSTGGSMATKKCPFCGSESWQSKEYAKVPKYCENCGAHLPTFKIVDWVHYLYAKMEVQDDD